MQQKQPPNLRSGWPLSPPLHHPCDDLQRLSKMLNHSIEELIASTGQHEAPPIGSNLRMVELKKEPQSPPHVIISCIARYLHIILPIRKNLVGSGFTPLPRHPSSPSIRRSIPSLVSCLARGFHARGTGRMAGDARGA